VDLDRSIERLEAPIEELLHLWLRRFSADVERMLAWPQRMSHLD
jgi:hypothetical protein